MKNYVQPGKNISIAAAPYAVASGAGCQVGAALFGVAAGAADNGKPVDLVTEGVFDITAKTTDELAIGAIAYWDNSNKEITGTASTHLRVGVAVAAKANPAATARVRLTP